MALRMERAETLEQELFVLQIMGDDRSIRQTYVAGKPMKKHG
jgi:guanine deaminase